MINNILLVSRQNHTSENKIFIEVYRYVYVVTETFQKNETVLLGVNNRTTPHPQRYRVTSTTLIENNMTNTIIIQLQTCT